MTGLLQQVELSIQNRRLLPRGSRILVAVSGGVDSMVLLNALHRLAARHRWQLTVAHFNHRLRGRASDADERFVRQAAAALKLPILVSGANVKAFACQSKLSVEMAARKLRHEFLAQAAAEHKIRLVALAHHADDQVELFFLRLLRGAGGEGLAGMKRRSPSPVDPKIPLVRPLLDVTKDELRRFAQENKIRFREDATNASTDLLRNRIRHELLPLLRKNYQPGLDRTVLRLMEIVGAESEFVSEATKLFCRSRGDEPQIKNGKRKAESGKLETPHVVSCSFASLPVAVQRRVLQLQLSAAGVPVDFDLVEQLRETPNRPVSVGSGLSVLREPAGRLKLQTQSPEDFNASQMAVALAGRAGEVTFDGVCLAWQYKTGKGAFRPARKKACEFFDADKVGNRIMLRHWRPGDRFQPIGLKSAAKLQDLFTNAKIPRGRRRELVVAVAESGGIYWVEGLRISEKFKLTPTTRCRLVWRWQSPMSFKKR